jgi:hypothetical protein
MFLVFKDLDESEVTPPQAILNHAQILREILSVYASALGDSASIRQDPSSEPVDEAAFEHILHVMVEPALQMCDAAAEEKKRVRGRWDREVFSLNCLTYLQVRIWRCHESCRFVNDGVREYLSLSSSQKRRMTRSRC